MKKVSKVANEVIAVQVLVVTLESLKNDLVALKDSVNISENLGGAFVLNSINANLSNEDLKALFEECKKVLSVSYAKKVCGAINIAYKTPLTDAQKALLIGKGFNVMYEQLRAFKAGAGAIVDSKQSIKVKDEKISQKRNNVNEAKKSKENHLENAVVDSKQSIKTKGEKVTQKRNDVNEAKKSKENHLENAVVDSKQSKKVKGEKVTQKMTDKEGEISSKNHLEAAIVESASLADIMDLLTSLSDIAREHKDNTKIIDFIATALLNIENDAYDMTA